MVSTPKPDPNAPYSEHLIKTLEQISSYLDTLQGNQVPADFFVHKVYSLPASTADTVRITVQRPFTHVVIPYVPRDLTLVGLGEAMQSPLLPIYATQSFIAEIPGETELTIQHSAGTGTVDTLDVYLSTRPFKLNVIDTQTQAPFTPSDAAANPTNIEAMESFLMGWDSVNLAWRRIQVSTGLLGAVRGAVLNNSSFGDASPAAPTTWIDHGGNARIAGVLSQVYNGATYDRPRTPNIQKTVSTAAAGDTAVWTPAGGKKFSLHSYEIELTEQATLAVAGILVVTLRDNATDMLMTHSMYVPAAAFGGVGTAYQSGQIQLGPKGFLSAAANNVLNVNLSVALTAGAIRVRARGTEE